MSWRDEKRRSDPEYAEKLRQQNREWKKRNRDKVRASKKAWRKTEAGKANKRKAKARQEARKRARETPFKELDGKRICRSCAKVEGVVRFSSGRWTCVECLRPGENARKKEYRKASEAYRILKRLRRRKQRAGSISAGMAVARHCKDLLTRQKWLCAVCRLGLKQAKHLDHVIPLAAGGKHEIGNFQWLCPPCNIAKGAKLPQVFMRERGFLI